MCGFAGIYNSQILASDSSSIIYDMLIAIKHRGPDNNGIYSDNQKIILGTVRLAMVDTQSDISILSDSDNFIHLAFNGEIYNYKYITKHLMSRGYTFKTASDGEVIINLYKEYGIDFLNYLDGMFAFALWDAKFKKLIIARDRLGIKPVYYTCVGDDFYFSSELKSLVAVNSIPKNLNHLALKAYYNLRFIPAPLTIYNNIYKLEPGSVLILEDNKSKIKNFWDPIPKNIEIREEFESIIVRDIKTTLSDEHTLGILLSGGLDSCSVLSAATDRLKPMPAFSIWYDCGTAENEIDFAINAARHFNSPHNYFQLNSADVLETLNKANLYLDEPIYSTVALSTYLVSKNAAQKVKGVLTGDGSDELQFGYNYHLAVLEAINNNSNWKEVLLNQAGWMSNEIKKWLLVDLIPNQELDIYVPEHLSPLDGLRYFELKYRLPDYHLARVDRLTMAHSLEARIPFLRNSTVDYFLSQDPKKLLIEGEQKAILKKAFYGRLPSAIISRKKQPFTTPYHIWLKSCLKDDVYSLLLDSNALADLGLCYKKIGEVLKLFYTDNKPLENVIWGIYNLAKWHNINVKS